MEDKHTKREDGDYEGEKESRFGVINEGKSIISAIKESNAQYKKYPQSKAKRLFYIVYITAIFASAVLMAIFAIRSGSENPDPLTFVFVGIFVGLIVGYIIVLSIKEKLAFKKPPIDAIRRSVEVVGCAVSSQKEVFGKITVTYRVMVSIDGENKETFSKKPYTVGEKISVYVKGDPVDKIYLPQD